MRMPEKTRMIRYYEDLYNKYGYDYRSLDWKDPAGQKARYAAIFDIVEMTGGPKNFSIADIGSGLGHFYGYLKEQGFLKKFNIDYSGYDINPKLVDAARKKHPETKFELKDILEGYSTQKFDYIISCGVFNIRLTDEAEHLEFVKEMMLRMYENCKIGTAVDFLSINGLPYVAGKEQGSVYYYFKPEEIIGHVRSISSKYILRHDYHPGDFTVYMLKERK